MPVWFERPSIISQVQSFDRGIRCFSVLLSKLCGRKMIPGKFWLGFRILFRKVRILL